MLGVTGLGGGVTFTSEGWVHTLVTVLTGPATAVPLLLFASSARRVSLSTLGLTQYLAPVMQLLVGVLVQHEPMSVSRWIGFGIVWSALVLLTVDSFTAARRGARPDAVPEPA
ncbi:EamA family transporter [Curtobacterium sp. MCJR17_043]|uniref:EamA family transporter n=1 Tax=Curtobacterium sp. MCJR17_043 TaxID=2175660 RepID=UPI0032E8AD8C